MLKDSKKMRAGWRAARIQMLNDRDWSKSEEMKRENKRVDLENRWKIKVGLIAKDVYGL